MRTCAATLAMTLLLTGMLAGTVRAADQDDGVLADDEVATYEDLSSSSRNYSYLAQRARSKAASGSGDVALTGSGALNSVILESGAEINGDIIIIDDSSGDKTILSN